MTQTYDIYETKLIVQYNVQNSPISLIEQHSGSWKNTVVIPFSVNFLHGKKPKIWRTLKKGQNLSRMKTWLFLCAETLVNILKQNKCKPLLEAMIVV